MRFLLVLLLGLAMACGSAATSAPASPAGTPAVDGAPSVQDPGSSPEGASNTGATPEPGPADATASPPASPAGMTAADGAPSVQDPGASPEGGSNAGPTPEPGPTEATASPPGSAAAPAPDDGPVAATKLVPETATAPVETTPAIPGPVLKVGNALFPVELALTPEQHIQGLSDRDALAPGTGMLFVFQQESRRSFWMKGMRFPLDIVWIGADCTVVDVTVDAPRPEEGQPPHQLPRFSPETPARYVLEINAGESAAAGIGPGDLVEFAGDLAGRYGC